MKFWRIRLKRCLSSRTTAFLKAMVLFSSFVSVLLIVASSFAAPARDISPEAYPTNDLDFDTRNNVRDKGLNELSDISPFVKWPSELEYPDCVSLFDDPGIDTSTSIFDSSSVDDENKVASRLTHSDDASFLHVPRNCSDYWARGRYATMPLSEEEASFPIAFANIVYTDFDLLERIFNVIYAPQNFYCYVVDEKASDEFKARFAELAACFPNVIIAPVVLSVFSSGRNVSAAHLACMRALDAHPGWKYVILLQNHDFPLRTNAELVHILRIFNGANDISTLKVTPSSVDETADYTFAHLNLFKNESLNMARLADGHGDARLYLTKSLVGVSVSRAMSSFILRRLNVRPFIDLLEEVTYGMDENFLSTLNSNDMIGMPGGFTRACLLRGQPVASITRYAVWNQHMKDCRSGMFRHGVCVFGVEDLRHLAKRNELFFNKIMPSFDYGAAMCWLEYMYNRTHYTRGGFHHTIPEDNSVSKEKKISQEEFMDELFSEINDYDNGKSDHENDIKNNNSSLAASSSFVPYFHELREEYYATLPHVRLHQMRRAASKTNNSVDGVDVDSKNIFFELLESTSGKNEIEHTEQAEDESGWNLMRYVYEISEDDEEARKNDVNERGEIKEQDDTKKSKQLVEEPKSENLTKPTTTLIDPQLATTEKAMTSEARQQKQVRRNKRIRSDSRDPIDYYNFNCTHPHRDYYF